MIFCAKTKAASSSVPGIRLNGLVTVRFTVLKIGSLQAGLEPGFAAPFLESPFRPASLILRACRT